MLQFYKDQAMTLPLSIGTPKKFLLPLDGGVTISTLWFGDGYYTLVTASSPGATQAASSSTDTTLNIADYSEFFNPGTAHIVDPAQNGRGIFISYTGISVGPNGATLTGITNYGSGPAISGHTTTAGIGLPYVSLEATVKPYKVYNTVGYLQLNTDAPSIGAPTLSVSFSRDGVNYNYPNSSLVTGVVSISSVGSPVPIYLEVSIGPGDPISYQGFGISTNQEYVFAGEQGGAPDPTGISEVPYGNFYVTRSNQQLNMVSRLLPSSRQVDADVPGFIVGEYLWRDETRIDSQVFTQTKFDPDMSNILTSQFQSGIGFGTDIQPIDIENVNDSIYLRVKQGTYFIASERFFLPDETNMFILNPNATSFNLMLNPLLGTIPFIGNFLLDSKGYFWKNVEYRYKPAGFQSGTGLAPYQFIFSPSTKTVTLSAPQPALSSLFLGSISIGVNYFNLPIYPIYTVTDLWVQASDGTETHLTENVDYVVNYELGNLTLLNTNLSSVPVVGSAVGDPIYFSCEPGLLVYFNTDDSRTYLEQDVDLNPAYAGISNGFVYIQHRIIEPGSITLSCDKPIINIPATYASIVGLVAYGPIYYNGDYALCTIQANDVNGQPVSGLALTLNFSENFQDFGLINYQNPITNPPELITGASGAVSFIFSPTNNYGYYMPITAGTLSPELGGLATTTNTDDTIILPAPVSISQIYDTNDGWLANLYYIVNNNPIFGMIGGNPALGQAVYATTGTPGDADFSSNGQKILWQNGDGQPPVYPIDCIDTNGVSFKTGGSSFNGEVAELIYSSASATLTLAVLASNIMTCTTSAPHGFTVGYGVLVTVTGAPPGVSNQYVIASIPTPTTFTVTGGVLGGSHTYSAGGTAIMNIPGSEVIAAYFVTYINRVTIQAEAVNSNIVSNTILLQMSPPPIINDDPWLIINDAVNGFLNQYRAGGSLPANGVHTPPPPSGRIRV
jgi:hypothetical protein